MSDGNSADAKALAQHKAAEAQRILQERFPGKVERVGPPIGHHHEPMFAIVTSVGVHREDFRDFGLGLDDFKKSMGDGGWLVPESTITKIIAIGGGSQTPVIG